jgi:dGTPase
VLDGLLSDPVFAPLSGYDGSHRAQAALKRVTSVLTGRFVIETIRATRDRYGPGPVRRYDADLVVPRRTRAQVALLKGIALRYVMRRPEAGPSYARQREMLRDLVTVLIHKAPDELDPIFTPLWATANDDAARLRVVIDQVASLTDPAAIAWHRRLCA